MYDFKPQQYILGVVFKGKPTMHQIKLQDGVDAMVGKTPLPGCRDITACIKLLREPVEKWPVVLTIAIDADGNMVPPPAGGVSRQNTKSTFDRTKSTRNPATKGKFPYLIRPTTKPMVRYPRLLQPLATILSLDNHPDLIQPTTYPMAPSSLRTSAVSACGVRAGAASGVGAGAAYWCEFGGSVLV